jgi:hypothetical protein
LFLVAVSLLVIGAWIDRDSLTPLARAASLPKAKASFEAVIPAAATAIGGTLTGNTHLAAGDYEVVSNLRVPVGISLSIDAGAHISFPASYSISVNGTLQVLGTAIEPVVFTSGRASPQAGDWSGISIVGNATDVLITHARIEYAATALTFEADSRGSVSGSLIRNNSTGIAVGYRAAPDIVAGNTITANQYGINTQGNGAVANNPAPLITGNALFGNSSYNLYTYNFGSPDTVVLDATANWWGSTDVLTIAAGIYDRRDNSSSPWVDFGGYWLEPNVGATRYFILNPREAAADTTVVSYADANRIVAPGLTLDLDDGASGVLPSGALPWGSTLSGDYPFTLGSGADATDLPVPERMLGNAFVIPHVSGSHRYHLFSPDGDSVAQLTLRNALGPFTQTLYLPQGQVVTFDAGSTNTFAGLIHADWPIAVLHDTPTKGDLYPVPPAAHAVWGVRSTSAYVGALENTTTVQVIADTGATQTLVLQAGEHQLVTVGAGTNQGRGSALYISADKPIAAIQRNDGDGAESTAFWPADLFATRHGLPVDAQYVAVVCATAATVTLTDGATPTTRNCVPVGARPGKVYFGSATAGVQIHAGAWLDSSAPVYVIYETAASNDEHNLLGPPRADGAGILQGTLPASTTLRGRYELLGNLTVPAGTTLSIAAGTTIRVPAGYTITVNGTLNIQGTAAAPVVFTSGKTAPKVGDWGGLIITGTATDVSIDYAIIEYAGTGLTFGPDSRGTVRHSTIRNNTNGVSVDLRAAPRLIESNTLTANQYGLRTQGNGTAANNPAPVVSGNALYGNTSYNYYAYNFGSPDSTVLDATGNWWGSTDVPTIAAGIYDYSDNSYYAPTVNFSGFLDANGNVVLYITKVTPTPSPFKPVVHNQMEFRFYAPLPLEAELRITPIGGTDALRVINQTFTTAGDQAIVWNGKTDNGATVPDGAYGWSLSTRSGSQAFTLEVSGMGGGGSGSGTIQPSYAVHKNEFWKIDYAMSTPGLVSMQVTPSGEAAFYPVDWKPYPAGTSLILWDGRRPDGSIVDKSVYIYFAPPNSLKSGTVIVEGSAPTVTGTGASPNIEVKSNPYLVLHSYEQAARITYLIDQDADVAVKLLPPGVLDFNSTAAISLLGSQRQTAKDATGDPVPHSVEWRGYDPTDTNDILVAQDGTYTFAIQATSAATGRTTLYRGALQLFR